VEPCGSGSYSDPGGGNNKTDKYAVFLPLNKVRSKSEDTSSTTHSQHDIRSPVHESHALTGNPKGFGLVGEETTIRPNLREERSPNICQLICKGYIDHWSTAISEKENMDLISHL